MDTNTTIAILAAIWGTYAWVRLCDWAVPRITGKGAKRSDFEQGLVEIHNIQALVKDSVDSGVLTAKEEQKLWEAAGRKCAAIVERIDRA
jgi:hypothetical protein